MSEFSFVAELDDNSLGRPLSFDFRHYLTEII